MTVAENPNRSAGAGASGLRTVFSVLGALVGMSLVAVVLGIMVWMGPDASPIPSDPSRKPPEELLRESRAAAEASRMSYGWVDEEAGIVRIPLELAVEKLLAEHGAADAARTKPDPAPTGQ